MKRLPSSILLFAGVYLLACSGLICTVGFGFWVLGFVYFARFVGFVVVRWNSCIFFGFLGFLWLIGIAGGSWGLDLGFCVGSSGI